MNKQIIWNLRNALLKHLESHKYYDDRGVPVTDPDFVKINENIDKQIAILKSSDTEPHGYECVCKECEQFYRDMGKEARDVYDPNILKDAMSGKSTPYIPLDDKEKLKIAKPKCDDCGDIVIDPQYNWMSYEGRRICVKCYYKNKIIKHDGHRIVGLFAGFWRIECPACQQLFEICHLDMSEEVNYIKKTKEAKILQSMFEKDHFKLHELINHIKELLGK